MHDPGKRHDRLRRHLRSSLAVASLLGALALGGTTQAAPFDEKLTSPVLRTVSEFRSQAEPVVAKYRALHESNPEQLVRDAALARQHFDIRWQLLRAVENRRVIEDPGSLGLVPMADGVYTIDLEAHPEWADLHATVAGMLSASNLDAIAPALIARGFRPDDLVTLKEYGAANDLNEMAFAAMNPLLLDFSRVVKKYDKIKRPVPDGLVESFYYQNKRAFSETQRRWVEGLLQKLDPQRVRVLLSALTEGQSTAYWAPSDFATARDELLADVRKPDFETRIKTGAKGVAP